MEKMFASCSALEYLDLSNFNISNVTSMEEVFNDCLKLKKIDRINKFKIIKCQIRELCLAFSTNYIN